MAENKRRDIFREDSMISKFHVPPLAEGQGPRDIDSPAKVRYINKLGSPGMAELNRL